MTMDSICSFFVCKEGIDEFIVREGITGIHLRGLRNRAIDPSATVFNIQTRTTLDSDSVLHLGLFGTDFGGFHGSLDPVSNEHQRHREVYARRVRSSPLKFSTLNVSSVHLLTFTASAGHFELILRNSPGSVASDFSTFHEIVFLSIFGQLCCPEISPTRSSQHVQHSK